MTRKLKTMDGNTAAAYVSYPFTDIAAIYPITPSSTMAEYADKWSSEGLKNIFGQSVNVIEMQSEAGAAGALHGSILSGALTTTYTASQGLLLMIPNMYKIAGEQMPVVIHASARTVSTHALSIFGDHSDVYACRQTGFSMLASTCPQEVMDLGAVAHLAAIKSNMPFLHFFDGFRTSHEMQKIEVWDYETLSSMIDRTALKKFRDRANLPDHPVLRGSAQNDDIFFQAREASNSAYLALPDIVEQCMNQINEKIGVDYKPFNYYGAPDAESVLVAMGSVVDAIEEVVDYLNARGEKTGLIKVRLYRPFSVKHLISVLPKSVKTIGVLDRTKEPGGVGEPLYLDVQAALQGSGVRVVGGRYGLASKNTPPSSIIAAFNNLKSENPINSFTIGIVDDVTHLSLTETENPDTTRKGIKSCKFWGIGSDGTVGANKNSIKIIGDNTDMNVQAYFQYDSRKSGGVTISHLRFGDNHIKSTYYVNKADFVACHVPGYLEKYDMVQDIKPGGVFLANCAWDVLEFGSRLPPRAKKYIADNDIKLYTCDAVSIASDIGLRGKTNTILQAAFFKLSGILPIDEATRHMKDAVIKSYGRKGESVVSMNMAAIDKGIENVIKIEIPDSWKNSETDKHASVEYIGSESVVRYVENVMTPINLMKGYELPVSAFIDTECGSLIPAGTSAYEKRAINNYASRWIPENCIQCNQCAFVCPHAVIRPYVLDDGELKAAPEGFRAIKMIGKGNEAYHFSVVSSMLDCTGCSSCMNICPAKNKAIEMIEFDEAAPLQKLYDYAASEISVKELGISPKTVKGSQFLKPLLEFPGACAGCGETPYAKLITQLFGDRMFIANATGCSSIWGGGAPTTPYSTDAEGRGPAWANSLFEDNAEFGFGMAVAMKQRRLGLVPHIEKLSAAGVKAASEWLLKMDDAEATKALAPRLEAEIRDRTDLAEPRDKALLMRDLFVKPSVWIFGGDGWAYDIGYGGLDHVIASGENVNILVFDTEVYSNTGGQASKATPTGAVAQFAAAGKSTRKKDLARIAMSYGYVYVAQIAMGASYQQTLDAIIEAESYDGPSIIIAYSPCIAHGMREGMGKSMDQSKKAVESGYWNLFRFDPRQILEGKNPLRIDNKAPTSSFRDFLMGQVRFSSLALANPERAEALFERAEQESKRRLAFLEAQREMYGSSVGDKG